MAVKIVLKHSSTEDKRPTPAQLENGEIALNYHEGGAFLTAKDAKGNIQQVGGVKISEVAPDNPVKQTLWFQPSSLTLFVYDGDSFLPVAGSGGGGGGTGDIITVIGNDGIDASEIAGVVTLDVDLAGGDDGLEFKGGALSASVATASALGSVKVGTGIDVTSDGTISIDVGSGMEYDGSGNIQVAVDDDRGIELTADGVAAKLGAGLSFDGDGKIQSDVTGGVKGTVDVTGTNFPASPQDRDFYVNVGDGNFSSEWAAVTTNADETTVAAAGDLLLYLSGSWEYVPTGGTTPGTDLDIDNRTGVDLEVTSTTGEDATVPAATASLAGLMTAADKLKVDAIPDNPNNLDDRYVEVTGDTMTGQLTLPGGGGSTEALQKQEVEALINASDTGDGKYLKLAADAGNQTVASTGNTTFDGKVGIGTTDPKTSLNVKGTTRLETVDNASCLSLAAADNTYSFIGSTPNNNLFINAGGATKIINLQTGGTDQVTINQDGKVGIGTTDPDELLHLSSNETTNLQVESTNTSLGSDTSSVILKNSTTQAASIKNVDLSDNVLWSIGRKFNGGLNTLNVDFDVNGKTATSISGSSGVLTSNYGLNLGVGGNNNVVPNGIFNAGADILVCVSKNTNTRFTSAGIRYTGPGDPFSVGSNIARIFDGYRTSGSNASKISNQFKADYQDSDLTTAKSQVVVQVRPSIIGDQTVAQGGITLINANTVSLDNDLKNVIAFSTSIDRAPTSTDETRFVLNSSGTAPSFHRGKMYFTTLNRDLYRYNTQYDGIKLAVNVTSDSPIEVTSTNTGNNNAKTAISFSKTDYTKSPGQSGYIAEAGSIKIGNGVGASAGMVYSCGANTTAAGFVSTSDYRLKTDITAMPSAVDRLKLLQPKTYKWIGTDEVVDGFLAHEVTPACSAAVFGQKDATEQIGTITTHTGVVVETGVPEPSQENLEYTEEVEVTPAVAYSAATYDEDGNELTPAQEAEEAVTQTITHTKTWTPTGTQPAYQSIDQTKLIPLLTKALQEALERIEVLEAAA